MSMMARCEPQEAMSLGIELSVTHADKLFIYCPLRPTVGPDTPQLPTLTPMPVAPVAYQVILEPGIDQVVSLIPAECIFV